VPDTRTNGAIARALSQLFGLFVTKSNTVANVPAYVRIGVARQKEAPRQWCNSPFADAGAARPAGALGWQYRLRDGLAPNAGKGQAAKDRSKRTGRAASAEEQGWMRFGLYVVGDEILSGRRSDRHLPQLVAMLGARGLGLSWAHFLPDEPDVLEAAFRRSFATDDVVFSCGGIGATPDDHTRQAAAAAADTDLLLHPEARDQIAEALAKRGLHDLSTPEGRRILMMGEFPRGASVIPNPYNNIPGFSIARHYFVPGFPVMAWPMIEWVLETKYREYFHLVAQVERTVLLYETRESTITPLMQQIEAGHPGVKTFSLPSVGDGSDGRPTRRHIELGVKGPPELVLAAFDDLRAQLRSMGIAAEAPLAGGSGPGQQ
jgi:molybdopterin-biosynthesis enzyme MoeA-like protein